MRLVLTIALSLAPAAACAQDLRLAKTSAGIALDWTGGSAPWDAIAFDLAGIDPLPASIDLGPVRPVECDSADATTRGGFEDALPGGLVGYLVRGTDYGASSDGRPRTPLSGDCGGGDPDLIFCNRWRSARALTSTDIWSGPLTGCLPGSLDPLAIDDALRRLDLYRSLAGLDPVIENPTDSTWCQEAALIQRGLPNIEYYPSPTDACYTADGSTASAGSNIWGGETTLAGAVDRSMQDQGVASLGHRRWLLYPDYAEAGFGHVDAAASARYPSYSVQWVVGWQASQRPAYVAWPAPGPFPVDAPLGTWSFQVDGASFASAAVEVLRMSDATPMSVTNAGPRNNGYGWNALGFDVAGVASDESYQVTVSGVSGAPQATYTYVVRFLTCP